MADVVIRNARHVLTMNDSRDELCDVDILLSNGVITAIAATIPTDNCDVIDASDAIVTPGLVNTHHHLYQTLTRAVPGAQDALLFGWLQRLYPIWARFGPEEMLVSAQIGLAELAL